MTAHPPSACSPTARASGPAMGAAVLLIAALGIAGCSDGDDSDAPDMGAAPAASLDAPNDGGGGADETTDDNASTLLDAPEPGRAILEVDDETFTAAVTSCEFQADSGHVRAVDVIAEGEVDGAPFEITGSAGRAGNSDWMVSVLMVVEEVPAYSNANSGSAEVAGRSVVIDGEWVWDDDGAMQSGTGRFAATCM